MKNIIRTIGLIGNKGAGKTTVFNMLEDLMPCREIMLAKPLKETCAKLCMLPIMHLESQELKERPLSTPLVLTPERIGTILRDFGLAAYYDEACMKHAGVILHTPRRVAQYVGTDILRDIDDQIHIRKAIDSLSPDVTNVVTDIRFLNELRAFEEFQGRGFVSMFIHNARAEEAARSDNHPSERDVPRMRELSDIVIDNNGTIPELRRNVISALTCLSGATCS